VATLKNSASQMRRRPREPMRPCSQPLIWPASPADLQGKVGLGPAVLLAQVQDARAKRHDRASLLVLAEPF